MGHNVSSGYAVAPDADQFLEKQDEERAIKHQKNTSAIGTIMDEAIAPMAENTAGWL